jgi:hypothetical protein
VKDSLNKPKDTATADGFFVPRIRGLRESAFWILAGLSVILLLALLSYNPVDPAFSVAGGDGSVANRMGPAGAWFADVAFLLVGETAYLFPVLVLIAGVFLFRNRICPSAGRCSGAVRASCSRSRRARPRRRISTLAIRARPRAASWASWSAAGSSTGSACSAQPCCCSCLARRGIARDRRRGSRSWTASAVPSTAAWSSSTSA